MKRDEHAIAIALRKLIPVVANHAVRRPMRGEKSGWRELVCAYTCLLAVTTIFGRQNQLLHKTVVVTLRPPIVAALLQKQHLFGWKRRLLVRLVEIWPIRMQLVSSVLRHEQAAVRVDGKAFAVADPGGEAIGFRKTLACFIGVVPPDAATRL